jgi:tetratricopeptide (TPR) repeat protein
MELDPDLPMVKPYLATALAQLVVPGVDTPENEKTAQRAIDVFLEVLSEKPHDVNSMKQVAGIYYSLKRLEDAKAWQIKVLAEDPKDAEAAYTIGAIDWDEANQNVLAMLTPVGMKDDGEGNVSAPRWVLETIEAQNAARVEEGLKYLLQALDSRPNYDDAMVYVNLMFRRKADVDSDNEAAREEDMAKASEWTTKAMDTRKANEQAENAGHRPATH